MIGFFKIKSLSTKKDSAGASILAVVSSQMDENITGDLYLPPYLRQTQSNISVGDVVFGIIDEVTGIGAALCGLDDADFGYFFNADINIKQKLTVNDTIEATNDIKSTSGDVKAGLISLKDHVHSAELTVEGLAATGTTFPPQ